MSLEDSRNMFERWYDEHFTSPAEWHADRQEYTVLSVKQQHWNEWKVVWKFATEYQKERDAQICENLPNRFRTEFDRISVECAQLIRDQV